MPSLLRVAGYCLQWGPSGSAIRVSLIMSASGKAPDASLRQKLQTPLPTGRRDIALRLRQIKNAQAALSKLGPGIPFLGRRRC